MQLVEVRLRDRGYPVYVGAKARELIGELIPANANKVAIITQVGIPWTAHSGRKELTIQLADGETAKTLSVVEDTCRKLAVAGFTRNDVIVALGGGVVTDVGGFVAAVYHRGIRFVNIATTLLGQVDAAIGGKTGVNLIEGKNLVGAFWQPTAVLCDTDTLTTLPSREYRSGLGEIAKYHFLGSVPQVPQPTAVVDAKVIAACIKIKADVVAADEREGNKRAILNYGHTLAHALETAGKYDLRHGEAVAIGIAFAAHVAHKLNRINEQRVAQHYQVLKGYDLPTGLPKEIDDEKLLALFLRDKKAIDGITMVLDGPNGVEPVASIHRAVLLAALKELR